MHRHAICAASLLCVCSPAFGAPFGAPLDDKVLATQRGGFVLPGGLQVALAVVSEASIDGQPVLRSTYTVEGNTAHLSVAANQGGGGLVAVDPAAPTGAVQIATQGGTTQVRFDSPGTDITTLVGNSVGSLVANTADGRAIDVQTTVDLNLGGATAQNLGTTMPSIEDLALSSAALLTH